MKHIAKLKHSEIYVSVDEVLSRYDISRSTLDRWIAKLAFPTPRKIVRKRYFLLSALDAWDLEQSGHAVEGEAETAHGLPIVSGVIQSYDDFVAAMVGRRGELALSSIELDAKSGMQEGYTSKLENYRKNYGRGMGPETFPLWLGGLRVGIVLVDLPRRPRKARAEEDA